MDTKHQKPEEKLYKMVTVSIPYVNEGECTLHPFSKSSSPFTFKTIYKKLYVSVFYFARRFVGPEDAEEITMDAFLKLWIARRECFILPLDKTFLQVCVRNACLDLLKKRKSISARQAGLEYHLVTAGLEDSGGEEMREALVIRLYAEIEKLPKKCRQVFKMAYLEGQSSKKIAAFLGISENTVFNQRKKALRILRVAVSNYQWILAFALLFRFQLS